jgi:hypothetical protein
MATLGLELGNNKLSTGIKVGINTVRNGTMYNRLGQGGFDRCDIDLQQDSL